MSLILVGDCPLTATRYLVLFAGQILNMEHTEIVKMNKIIIALFLSIAFVGCGGNIDYDKAATQTGVEQETLKRLCKGITCNYDDLKDRIEVTANDGNSFLTAMSGNENRKIEFTWVSGWEEIEITVFDVFLYGSWHFDEYAEIFINKEMVVKIDGQVDRIVGKYNDVASDHEQIEKVSRMVKISTARRIAEADASKITIRFYGKKGYTDVNLSGSNNLIQAVKLAETMR